MELDPLFKNLSIEMRQCIRIVYDIMCSAEPNKPNKQAQNNFAINYTKRLDIKSEDFSLIRSLGAVGAVKLLAGLSETQKEYLATLCYDLLRCNGAITNSEWTYFNNVFETIGISSEKGIKIIEKHIATIEHFRK